MFGKKLDNLLYKQI